MGTKFNLAGERIVNRLKSWNVVAENMAQGANDIDDYRYRGEISMWTKTDKDTGDLLVRVAVPTGGLQERNAIEFKRPSELEKTDVVLFRIREIVAMSSSAEHHAVHHNKTNDEPVYAIVGVSGAKKKGKYFFYNPVFVKDAEQRNQLYMDLSDKPVPVDSRNKGVDHNMTQDWGGYVKGFFAYFQDTFGLRDGVTKYTQMASRT